MLDIGDIDVDWERLWTIWRVIEAAVVLGAICILSAFIIGTFGGAWIALRSGDIGALGDISTFLSALVSIALVIVTAVYVLVTRSLVNETKESREQNERLEYERREREEMALRRALLYELEELNTFHNFQPELLIGSTAYRQFSTPVYRENTEAIGKLTDSEAEAVIRFYTRLHWFTNDLVSITENERMSANIAQTDLNHIEELRQGAINALQGNLEKE